MTAGVVAWLVVIVSVIPCLGIHTYELPRVSPWHGGCVSLAVIALDRAMPRIAARFYPPEPQVHNLVMCAGSLCVWLLCVCAARAAHI